MIHGPSGEYRPGLGNAYAEVVQDRDLSQTCHRAPAGHGPDGRGVGPIRAHSNLTSGRLTWEDLPVGGAPVWFSDT